MREEVQAIGELSSNVILSIDFKDIKKAPKSFQQELRKRGVTVVRGVVPEVEARSWIDTIEEFVRANPHIRRRTTWKGLLPLDFPSGEGESRHVGRFIEVDLRQIKDADARRSFGFDAWNSDRGGLKPGETAILKKASQILGVRIGLLRKLAIVCFILRLSISFSNDLESMIDHFEALEKLYAVSCRRL